MKQLYPTVYMIEPSLLPGEVGRFLLISDVHFDSTHCDRDLLTKHLDTALATNASVLVFGDWFDLMQGMYDPRRSYSGLRPEYKSITYLDDVIEDSAEYLKKYKNQIKFFGRGNHETNIEKRLSTSPLDRLSALLGAGHVGSYAGWIFFRFTETTGRKRAADCTYKLHFHHGYGGNAPRSKGVLAVDIDQKEWPDADMIVSGHTHQKWHVPITVERINKYGRIRDGVVHHIKLGSYKELDRFAGWEVEKGFQKPRLGGWWVDMKPARRMDDDGYNRKIEVVIREAT
jgi:UDP-2,3-diacylglucosamine pyrophosphatase LpxH